MDTLGRFRYINLIGTHYVKNRELLHVTKFNPRLNKGAFLKIEHCIEEKRRFFFMIYKT